MAGNAYVNFIINNWHTIIAHTHIQTQTHTQLAMYNRMKISIILKHNAKGMAEKSERCKGHRAI